MKNIRNNINKKLKNEYLEMLRLIVTSTLPIKQQAQMIEALRSLQKKNKEEINIKASELIREMIGQQD